MKGVDALAAPDFCVMLINIKRNKHENHNYFVDGNQ